MDVYQVISLSASFLASFLVVFASKRSILFLAVMAVILFVLFGPLALPGFFVGIGAAVLAKRLKGKK